MKRIPAQIWIGFLSGLAGASLGWGIVSTCVLGCAALSALAAIEFGVRS